MTDGEIARTVRFSRSRYRGAPHYARDGRIYNGRSCEFYLLPRLFLLSRARARARCPLNPLSRGITVNWSKYMVYQSINTSLREYASRCFVIIIIYLVYKNKKHLINFVNFLKL